MNRMTPFSSHSHDRPSSIWLRVRQRKPSGSRSMGSIPSSCSCAAEHAGMRTSRSSSRAARSPVSPGAGASWMTKTGCPGRSSRGCGRRDCASSHSSETARASPISIRGAARATSRANAPHPSPDGTTLTPMWQRASSSRPSARATKRPSPRLATSSRNTRSTGSCAQNRRIWSRFGAMSFSDKPRTL